MARRKKASQMTSEELIEVVDGDLFDFSDPTEEDIAEAERLAEEEAIPNGEREENWMIEFRQAGTVPG